MPFRRVVLVYADAKSFLARAHLAGDRADAFDRFLGLDCCPVRRERNVPGGQTTCQGRAQFVGAVGGQRSLSDKGFLQTLQQLVQPPRQGMISSGRPQCTSVAAASRA